MDTRLEPFRFQIVTWQSHKDLLMDVRLEVFVQEQSIDVSEEIDHYDPKCMHMLVSVSENIPVACSRLILHESFGQIGRIAVKKQWRGLGLGGAMIALFGQECLQRGLREIRLSSQVQALDFYRKFDFHPYGEIFIDANIPHQWMKRVFPDS